jgi:wyosine [tRNA(Phe)-imidazoG37] synthetase (radical SAM superfamily)
MNYPNDANGDVFRRMEAHGFYFSKEYVVDFHAVMATEEEADQIARMYVADDEGKNEFVNIETKAHPKEGMEVLLSKKMIVSHEAVTKFETILADRVSKLDGYLDGWGVLSD